MRSLASLLAVLALLAPRAAEAGEGARTVVLYVEGPAMAEVASALVSALPEGAEARPPRAFRRAFGSPLLGPEPERWVGPRDRATFLARVQRAAGQAGARFAILASTRLVDGGAGLEVWLAVIGDGDDEAAVRVAQRVRLEADAAAGSAAAERNTGVLAPLLTRGITGAASGPAPAAEPPPRTVARAEARPDPPPATAEPAEPARPPRAPRTATADVPAGDPAWYRVEIGGELAGRSFVYVDRLSPGLRPYRAFGTPLVTGRAEVLPLHGHESWALRALGAYGEIGYAPKMETLAPDGTRIENRWMRFDGGVLYRAPLAGDGATLGASAGYGGLRFAFLDAGDLADEVPGVSYRWLRLGGHGSVAHQRVRLEAGVAYLLTLSSGQTAARFSESRVGGLEAELALRWRIAARFEARSALRYARIFYDIRPVLGDTNVAGGALDEYVGVVLSVGLRN